MYSPPCKNPPRRTVSRPFTPVTRRSISVCPPRSLRMVVTTRLQWQPYGENRAFPGEVGNCDFALHKVNNLARHPQADAKPSARTGPPQTMETFENPGLTLLGNPNP